MNRAARIAGVVKSSQVWCSADVWDMSVRQAEDLAARQAGDAPRDSSAGNAAAAAASLLASLTLVHASGGGGSSTMHRVSISQGALVASRSHSATDMGHDAPPLLAALPASSGGSGAVLKRPPPPALGQGVPPSPSRASDSGAPADPARSPSAQAAGEGVREARARVRFPPEVATFRASPTASATHPIDVTLDVEDAVAAGAPPGESLTDVNRDGGPEGKAARAGAGGAKAGGRMRAADLAMAEDVSVHGRSSRYNAPVRASSLGGGVGVVGWWWPPFAPQADCASAGHLGGHQSCAG